MDLQVRRSDVIAFAVVVAAFFVAPQVVAWIQREPPPAEVAEERAPDADPFAIDVGGLVTHGTGSGAGGGGAAGAADGQSESAARRGGPAVGLVLRVRPAESEVPAEGPVWARVLLVNVGGDTVTLCDPRVDLARRVELLYTADGRERSAQHGHGPQKPLDRTLTVPLAPGAAVDLSIDLRPLLERAEGFDTGPFRFRLAYRGAADALPPAVSAWNGDPRHVAVSQEVLLQVPPPGWFVEAGGDADSLGDVTNRIARWTPGSPDDDAVTSAIRSLDEPGTAALALLAQRLDQPWPRSASNGSRALRMLRRLGARALPALRHAPAHPATAMISAIVLEDDDERFGRPPADAAAPFRALGSDPALGLTFSVSESLPGAGAVTWTLDPAGRIFRTRVAEGAEPASELLPAGFEDVARVKRTLLGARPWTWAPVRTVRRAAEGEVSYRLTDAAGATLWVATLPGDEARRGNPFASDVLEAFRALRPEDPSESAAR